MSRHWQKEEKFQSKKNYSRKKEKSCSTKKIEFVTDVKTEILAIESSSLFTILQIQVKKVNPC